MPYVAWIEALAECDRKMGGVEKTRSVASSRVCAPSQEVNMPCSITILIFGSLMLLDDRCVLRLHLHTIKMSAFNTGHSDTLRPLSRLSTEGIWLNRTAQ